MNHFRISYQEIWVNPRVILKRPFSLTSLLPPGAGGTSRGWSAGLGLGVVRPGAHLPSSMSGPHAEESRQGASDPGKSQPRTLCSLFCLHHEMPARRRTIYFQAVNRMIVQKELQLVKSSCLQGDSAPTRAPALGSAGCRFSPLSGSPGSPAPGHPGGGFASLRQGIGSCADLQGTPSLI